MPHVPSCRFLVAPTLNFRCRHWLEVTATSAGRSSDSLKGPSPSPSHPDDVFSPSSLLVGADSLIYLPINDGPGGRGVVLP